MKGFSATTADGGGPLPHAIPQSYENIRASLGCLLVVELGHKNRRLSSAGLSSESCKYNVR